MNIKLCVWHHHALKAYPPIFIFYKYCSGTSSSKQWHFSADHYSTNDCLCTGNHCSLSDKYFLKQIKFLPVPKSQQHQKSVSVKTPHQSPDAIFLFLSYATWSTAHALKQKWIFPGESMILTIMERFIARGCLDF